MGAAAIVSLITGALIQAPDIIKSIQDARQLIAAAFALRIITAQEQDELFAHVNDIAVATLKGERPPAWQVQTDPQ